MALVGKHVGIQLSAPQGGPALRTHYPNVGLLAAVSSGIAGGLGGQGRLTIELDESWKGRQVDSLCEVLSFYYHVSSAASPFLETNILIPYVSGVSILRSSRDIDVIALGNEQSTGGLAESILASREAAGLGNCAVEYVEGRKMESVKEIIKGSEIQEETPNPMFSVNGFSDVACGGTFDRLHAGHKVLLSAAAMLGKERLVVGVSGDPLLKSKKFSELLQPYSEREKAVHNFVSLFRPHIKVETVELLEPFGPTITDEKLQALVVSDETRDGGNAINVKRNENGMGPMSILSIKLVGASASKLSSTWYREQEAARRKNDEPSKM